MRNGIFETSIARRSPHKQNITLSKCAVNPRTHRTVSKAKEMNCTCNHCLRNLELGSYQSINTPEFFTDILVRTPVRTTYPVPRTPSWMIPDPGGKNLKNLKLHVPRGEIWSKILGNVAETKRSGQSPSQRVHLPVRIFHTVRVVWKKKKKNPTLWTWRTSYESFRDSFRHLPCIIWPLCSIIHSPFMISQSHYTDSPYAL